MVDIKVRDATTGMQLYETQQQADTPATDGAYNGYDTSTAWPGGHFGTILALTSADPVVIQATDMATGQTVSSDVMPQPGQS